MGDPGHSEQLILRELFDKAPLPYQSLDEHGCVRMVNEAWLDMVGYTLDEVIGRPVSDFLLPEYSELFHSRFGKFVQCGVVDGAHFVFKRRDGGTREVEVKGRISYGENGGLRTHCICRDVTDERAALAELAASEQRFRTLVETAQEGIWQIDADAVTVYVNPAMARMLGYSGAEMEGRHLYDFMDEEGVDICKRNLERRENGLAEQHDFEFRHTDGRKVVATLATAPLTDGEGRYRGAIAGVMDITDRVRYDQKMRETQKLESLKVMAGGIAHDFNNLLQTIVGNADLAMMVGGEDRELAASLEAILAASGQASGLCRQMLAYAGKGEYAKEQVLLHRLLGDMEPLLRTAVSRKVGLRVDLPDKMPALLADPVQLGQVVMNLVTNASESMENRTGEVVVAVIERDLTAAECRRYLSLRDLAPGRYVVLSVEDNGCGMDDDVQAGVWDPFFTTKFAGRGLGMAVVRGVALAHGGAVRLSSDVGSGTRVEVYLPAQAEVAEETPAPAAPPRTRGRTTAVHHGRVLLVDDEEAVLTVARRMLDRMGWQVETARDGEEAASAVEASPTGFDLVILDWSMPVLDGHEALARMRAVAPQLPVLVSSGHATAAVQEHFEALGPTGFLAKPFKLEELAAAVAPYARTADI